MSKTAKLTNPLQTIAGGPSAPETFLFLSPEWVRQVIRTVESAKQNDPALRARLSDYTVNVHYIVRNVPPHLRPWYGKDGQAEIFVELKKGSVRRVFIGRKPARARPDLIVTVEYKVARKLFLGQLSPAVSFINRRVKAEPVNGFRHWPKLAAKSIVTGSQVLKLARKVPTRFEPRA